MHKNTAKIRNLSQSVHQILKKNHQKNSFTANSNCCKNGIGSNTPIFPVLSDQNATNKGKILDFLSRLIITMVFQRKILYPIGYNHPQNTSRYTRQDIKLPSNLSNAFLFSKPPPYPPSLLFAPMTR